MHARIDNPALTVPGALKALPGLGNAVRQADIPETTLYLVELRASQITGCSVCVDMHSHELKLAGEPDERVHAVAAWRETPYFSDPERAALALTEAATRLADSQTSSGTGVEQQHAKQAA
jgi:AhpD family alkylhydroperoxidase